MTIKLRKSHADQEAGSDFTYQLFLPTPKTDALAITLKPELVPKQNAIKGFWQFN